MQIESTPCCGVDWIEGLYDGPEAVLLAVCEERYPTIADPDRFNDPQTQAFFVFADAVHNFNGQEFVDYLKKHKLGYTVATRQKINPNSENAIKAWIWSPDNKALRKWFRSHLI